MLRKPLAPVLGCALLLVLGVVLSGCGGGVHVGVGDRPAYGGGPPAEPGPPPWAPAHGYRAKHRYRYYPDSQVYYDEGRGVYIYYRRGDWRVSASLPSGIHVTAGDFVTLEMDTDRPYEHHGEVRRHYPPGQIKGKGRGRGKGKGRN